MPERDGPAGINAEWIKASSISTFVYCEMKYRLNVSPPEDYVEPAAVIYRKSAGVRYHRRKGILLGLRVAAQRLILLAALLLISVGVAVWFLH